MWFICIYEGGLNPIWQHISCAFSCLHIHDAHLICATWDVQIRIGSPEPCSVNPALDSLKSHAYVHEISLKNNVKFLKWFFVHFITDLFSVLNVKKLVISSNIIFINVKMMPHLCKFVVFSCATCSYLVNRLFIRWGMTAQRLRSIFLDSADM